MAVGSGLKKQITSITSISKITKAMELVSTAKLKKAAKRIIDLKPYFAEVYTVFNDIIGQAENTIYQANDAKEFKNTAWIVVNSNLGLCGGYNVNVNKMVLKEIKHSDHLITIGNKAQSYFNNHNFDVARAINNVDINFQYEDARDIAVELLSKFSNKEFDSIKIAYTKFINNVTFEPTIIQLLPIQKTNTEKTKTLHIMTEFEPSAEEVLASAVPMYMNSIVFSAVVESQVSEQASRRSAMENATDNAHDMLEKLSLEYNRKRQAAITQEISEIVAGASAQND